MSTKAFKEQTVYEWLTKHSLGNKKEIESLKKHLDKIQMKDVHKIVKKMKASEPKWRNNQVGGNVYGVFKSVCDLYNWYVHDKILEEPVPPTESTECPTDVYEFAFLLDDTTIIKSVETAATAPPPGTSVEAAVIAQEQVPMEPQVPNVAPVPPAPAYRPPDYAGKIVEVHGEVALGRPHFVVPDNTYIVYMTTLGRSGSSNESNGNLLQLFTNENISNELLHLLAFDYEDTYLGQFPYLKNRTIYTPARYCVDTLISNPPIIDHRCHDLFEQGVYEPKRNLVHYSGIKTDPNTGLPLQRIDHVDVGFLGIYDVPIKPVPGMLDTLIPSGSRYLPQDRYIKLVKKSDNQNPTPDVIYVKRNLLEVPVRGYTYGLRVDNEKLTYYNKKTNLTSLSDYPPVPPLTKNEARLYDEVDSRRRVVSLRHPTCGLNKYDDPRLRNYKLVADYTNRSSPKPIIYDEHGNPVDYTINDTATHEMYFSELVQKLRAETDAKFGPQKRLIILTGQCRVFQSYDQVAKNIDSCIHLENRMTKFLMKKQSEKYKDIRLAKLKKCMEKIQQFYPLATLQEMLQDEPDAEEMVTYEEDVIPATPATPVATTKSKKRAAKSTASTVPKKQTVTKKFEARHRRNSLTDIESNTNDNVLSNVN
jgi:hypothetical protein